MEEQKYYTPSPEDIRPGLVFEHKRWIDGEDTGWATRIMPANGIVIQNILQRMMQPHITVRVPYLTAEQIEAEGWKYLRKNGYNNNVYELIKNGLYYTLHFNQNQKFNVTVHTHADKSFSGTCRCINDLRLICKLLGI
jgi:hypothetical protein